jgi:hypothetical protein
MTKREVNIMRRPMFNFIMSAISLIVFKDLLGHLVQELPD